MSTITSTKVARTEKDKDVELMKKENERKGLSLDQNGIVDWTILAEEVVSEFFSRLNTRDRASLSSTCQTWRYIGTSPFLWQSLDVRAYKFDATTAQTLSSRCKHLSRLTFHEVETSHPIMNLNAHNLKELIGYRCHYITDATISEIVVGHPCLETLQLGPWLTRFINSHSVKTIAYHCPNLRKLKLSGITDIDEVAINALATCCGNLEEIGFTDCININERALGNVLSLRFLSVAGTINMCWVSVSNSWTKLPNLVGLDVSRTNVDRNCVSMLLSSSSGLRVLCALTCHLLPVSSTFSNLLNGAKKLVCDIYDLHLWICTSVENLELKEKMKFRGCRSLFVGDEKETGTMMDWLECVFSHFFLRCYQSNPVVTRDFWYDLGTVLLFSLIKSPQEDVIEIGMSILSSVVINGEESTHFREVLAKKIPPIGDEDIGFLIHHSRSHQEGLQLQAIKAIANLSTDSYFRASIIRQGGLAFLSDLTKSKSRLLVEAAAEGLYNLSLGCDSQLTCFIDAGGIKALVDLLSKWLHNEYVLKLVAGALANLASHKTCAAEILSVGGVNAILKHAFDRHFPRVSVEALQAVAQLCFHGDKEHDYAGIGNVAGVFKNLVELTYSVHDRIRREALAVLWNLCCYKGHFKATEAAAVIEAFVDAAQPGNSPALQQRAARYLWDFSALKEYNIAVGERGGIAVLLALTRSNVSKVRDKAAGTLCHLAFLPCNALRIKNEKGVAALIEFCKLTQSKAARFYSTLALACMHDERMVEYEKTTGPVSGTREVRLFWDKELASNQINEFIPTVCDPTIFSVIAASPTSLMLQKQAKALYIEDAECPETSLWVTERLISLLRDSSSGIKACAAFALVQYTTPCNIHWMENKKYVQEAGGPKVLRALAASKISPDAIKILSKIVLFCLEQKQIETPSTSSIQRREKRKKT